MSADEDEGTGVGPILWVIGLCIVGALVLVALFMQRDTTDFFLALNERFLAFFDTPFFVAAKFISGILIVALAAFATWMFFKLLEMEKEHEEHVYHHAEDHHTEAHHAPAHHRETVQPHYSHTEDPPDQASTDHTPHIESHSAPSQPEAQPPVKTAPPPARLPGESGVRGSQEGIEHPGHYQWQSVLRLATSNNPSDWKLAIIEADVILDMMTYMQGFPGETLGERLKNADVGYFKTLKYAKQAHHMRNQIAHEGDLQLTPRDVNQTIRMYEAVFDEFKYI